MDHFLEEVVVKRKRGLDEVLYYLSLVIMVFAALIGMMFISSSITLIASGQFDWFSLVFGLIQAAIAVLIWLYHDRLRTEYEYTFTNGTLDFAQVFNNKKRKSLGSLNVKTIDAFGKVASGAFHRYISMQNVQQSRWFLNREAELYFFFFQKDGNKRIIVFEPSQEMVDHIRHYLPYGAYQES
ncbi:MAG: hypothetical protein IJ083_01355 [Clostridia bacterium]|nr:hypothetical protein [Clostridia bacterium]